MSVKKLLLKSPARSNNVHQLIIGLVVTFAVWPWLSQIDIAVRHLCCGRCRLCQPAPRPPRSSRGQRSYGSRTGQCLWIEDYANLDVAEAMPL
jgi:hypothetical protein